MKWEISNLAITSQPLGSLYPCLKKFGYSSEDIKDSSGYLKYVKETIDIDNTIYEGKQLRELQEDLNESSFNMGVHKRLIVDFENHKIVIMDVNGRFVSATNGSCNGVSSSSNNLPKFTNNNSSIMGVY